jgi:NAD(P)H dehydrogenase (quinone)
MSESGSISAPSIFDIPSMDREGFAMNKREFLETAGAASTAAAVLLASGPIHAQTPATSVTVLVAYHSVTGNTEKMAKGVAEGVNSLSGTNVVLKKVGEVTTDDLLACDALIVGSPVYNANIAGEVKTFFDTKVSRSAIGEAQRAMRNKIGGAFVTGGSISNGKETTVQTIYTSMLSYQMCVVSGGRGAFGASATTGADSPGVDEKELEAARALGRRVAEFAGIIKRGSKS